MVRAADHVLLFERIREILSVRSELAESLESADSKIESKDLRAAREGLIGLAIYGERLLLFMKPLTEAPGVQTFLDYKHIAEKVSHSSDPPMHGDRTKAKRLVEGTRHLLNAFDRWLEECEFRFSGLADLPPPASGDIRTAQDLISVGESEAAFFYVCRAMESVVRSVASGYGITGDATDRRPPSLSSLIRGLSHSVTESGECLLSRKDGALLEYARESRNELAHTGANEDADLIRQTALVYDATQSLWVRARAQGNGRGL